MQLSCCQNICARQHRKIGCSQSSTRLLHTSQYLWFIEIILHRLRVSLLGSQFHTNLQQNVLMHKGTRKDQIQAESTCTLLSLLVEDNLFISLKEICNNFEEPHTHWYAHSSCDIGMVQIRLRRLDEKRRTRSWVFQVLLVHIRSETFKSWSKLSILI